MEEKKILQFDLFGSFACREAGDDQLKERMIPDKVGKKALSFLQYLIVNHARNISSEELMEQFWSERDNGNPSNSLNNMMFKTRSLLKTIFQDQENLLLTLQGCYAWNPCVQIQLDSEEFENICLQIRKQSGTDYLDTLLKAVNLYKGDFLSGNDSEWAVSLRRYYQTLYLDACRMALPLLQEKERWTEVISICEQACEVDFSADTFIVYQMQALISMGYPERAVEAYQAFRKMLWEEFEIEPTEQVEEIHMLADSMCQNNMDSLDILKLVAEGESEGNAFFCTFSVFRSIVALEKRHLSRSGQSSVVVLVSLGSKVTPTTDARRLERVLLEGLRTGDPVARLDASSYILMLSGVSLENAEIVMRRIDQTFHKTYSHSKACILYRMSVLATDGVQVS